MTAAARAQTEAEAANLALAHLGQPPIADLSDRNIRARAVRMFFGIVRDDMLRQKWWSFAKGWVTPAADVIENIGPLRLRYPLPPDCVRVRYLDDGRGGVFDEDSGAWDIEVGTIDVAGVQIETTVLVTNITAPLIAYTKAVDNVRVWWPDFVAAFALELASRCATKLGRSPARASELHGQAADKLSSASGIDSKEASRKNLTRTPSIIAARRGFRSAW